MAKRPFTEYVIKDGKQVIKSFHKKAKNFKSIYDYQYTTTSGSVINMLLYVDKNGQVYDCNPRTCSDGDLFNKFYGRPYSIL